MWTWSWTQLERGTPTKSRGASSSPFFLHSQPPLLGKSRGFFLFFGPAAYPCQPELSEGRSIENQSLVKRKRGTKKPTAQERGEANLNTISREAKTKSSHLFSRLFFFLSSICHWSSPLSFNTYTRAHPRAPARCRTPTQRVHHTSQLHALHTDTSSVLSEFST